jgi:hypothetical protein
MWRSTSLIAIYLDESFPSPQRRRSVPVARPGFIFRTDTSAFGGIADMAGFAGDRARSELTQTGQHNNLSNSDARAHCDDKSIA